MIVTENSEWREQVERHLRGAKAEVTSTADGMRCMEMLRKQRFDLVLIDESIRQAGPVEVLLTLRDLSEPLPITLVTGSEISRLEKVWKRCDVFFYGSRLDALPALERAIAASAAPGDGEPVN